MTFAQAGQLLGVGLCVGLSAACFKARNIDAAIAWALSAYLSICTYK